MRLPALAAAALLAACQAGPPRGPVLGTPRLIAPHMAVLAAADAAPRGVPGTFAMTVRRADVVGPRLFLNSHPDYRDQRNLSIAIQLGALAGLRQRLGPDVRGALLGREVHVSGVARRVQIDFINSDGRRSGKYYYQTHVGVTDPDQIRIVR